MPDNVRYEDENAKVGVVIVNWNGWRDSLEAYRSLEQSSHQNWFCYLVDNASSDDSVAELKGKLKQGSLIESSVNMGFSGGCNVGIKVALRGGCRYVFLLNSDALVKPDTIAKLVEASRSLDDSSILGCVVRFHKDGSYQFFGSRTDTELGLPRWYTEDSHYLLVKELIDSDFVYGAALFCPESIIERVGMLDERFFLNYEETDFCYRAKRLGVQCKIVSGATVLHRSGASLGDYESPMQSYFLPRNELLFVERHGTLRSRRGLYKHRLRKVRTALKAMISGRATYSDKAMLLAMRDYLLRRFGDCPATIRRYAKLDRELQLKRQAGGA